MIGKQENNHQTELIKIYNQVSKWLSSPQAITDVENILYNNFRKGLERIDEEISSLGFESDLWTIRAFYKNGRISELFTFTHFTNWLKDTKEDHFDRILEKFETTSIPIDVGIALKKLSHLQFFWDVETSEVSISYLGNKVSENLLEIGIVNNLFKFTEKAHKKGIAKIILDYLLLGETGKLNQVIKRILQELEVDFKEIQESVKTRLVKNGDLFNVNRLINLRANLDYYTKDKEYRRIIIPFKFRCNQESQGTYESQLTSKIYEISYKLENGKIDGKSPKEFIKEFAHSQLVTEYLQITQKYSETTLSTFLKLLQKGTSSEFDTDRNYYSEVVEEVKEYLYNERYSEFKIIQPFLLFLNPTDIFEEEELKTIFVEGMANLDYIKKSGERHYFTRLDLTEVGTPINLKFDSQTQLKGIGLYFDKMIDIFKGIQSSMDINFVMDVSEQSLDNTLEIQTEVYRTEMSSKMSYQKRFTELMRTIFGPNTLRSVLVGESMLQFPTVSTYKYYTRFLKELGVKIIHINPDNEEESQQVLIDIYSISEEHIKPYTEIKEGKVVLLNFSKVIKSELLLEPLKELAEIATEKKKDFASQMIISLL